MKASLALQALVGLVAAFPTPDTESADSLVPRQATSGRFCSPTTQLCYNEYATQGGSVFRLAIPDNASGTNFDIALQLVAPRGQGWVGLSFGGSMTQAPLAVAWPNGQGVTASSRWADSHSVPSVYNGATYTVLSDTGVNGTHYTLSAVCSGCSSWARGTGTRTLNPNGGIRVAWAQNTQAASVAQPANPASNFNYHNFHGYFDADLGTAKVPVAQFQSAAAMTQGGAAPVAAVAEPFPATPQPAPLPQPVPWTFP